MNLEQVRPTVCVVGLGYIGLPTAVLTAEAIGRVAGFDIDAGKRRDISNGIAPASEEDLSRRLRDVLADGNLQIIDELQSADVFIFAVPTPIDSKTKEVDLSHLWKAALAVLPHLSGDELLVIESTSPPGTTAALRDLVLSKRRDLVRKAEEGFLGFAYCPERVMPGRIMGEIKSNARVIGGLNATDVDRACCVYESFCDGDLLKTSAETAEMVKLAENAFRDVNIAFANELEAICYERDVNIWEVLNLANRHPRVNILRPGPGVGGHCIAVDPWILAGSVSAETPLIQSARTVNDGKPLRVVRRALELLAEKDRPLISILGLAFKENVEDVRESPALEIVRLIADMKPTAQLEVFDPWVAEEPMSLQRLPNVKFYNSADHVNPESDLVLGLVSHCQFLDSGFQEKLRHLRVLDVTGRMIVSPK